MDELIDILDAKGNYTGRSALKSEAHKNGWWHPTIHVWCYTRTGKVLLQQRGKHKDSYPLKWDVSVAGHIGAGESNELGAIRETMEEIGVQIVSEDLEKLTVFKQVKNHSNTFLDCEFCHTYLCKLDEHVPLKKQDSEVEALQWLMIDEFKKRIASNHLDLIPNSEERFYFVLSEIESRIKKSK
ncbi:NUDIX domain-containing protein [uncultured Croceitalea sp.]|uniref:NUDIX hydrolase n=1 Tax=uncultured Croceitalea sp. TaxID=1798908 RepID=UPI003306035A